MKIFFSITAIIISSVAMCECPIQLESGQHSVVLKSYYCHMDINDNPHLTEAVASGVFNGPAILSANADRYSIGYRWWIDGKVFETCGELGSFAHDFETGTTNRWTTVVGGK